METVFVKMDTKKIIFMENVSLIVIIIKWELMASANVLQDIVLFLVDYVSLTVHQEAQTSMVCVSVNKIVENQ